MVSNSLTNSNRKHVYDYTLARRIPASMSWLRWSATVA